MELRLVHLKSMEVTGIPLQNHKENEIQPKDLKKSDPRVDATK